MNEIVLLFWLNDVTQSIGITVTLSLVIYWISFLVSAIIREKSNDDDRTDARTRELLARFRAKMHFESMVIPSIIIFALICLIPSPTTFYAMAFTHAIHEMQINGTSKQIIDLAQEALKNMAAQ